MPGVRPKPHLPIVNWGHPLARGLVAAYVFPERDGPARDYARYHHATMNGNPTRVADLCGYAAALDGTGDYYDAGDHDDFSLTSVGFSIAARIKPATLGGGNRNWIAAKGGPGAYEWAFAVDAGTSNDLYFEHWALDGGSGSNRFSSSAISTGVWTNVAGVFANNLDATVPDLYINGALNNGTSNSPIGATQGNGTASMQIGRRADGGDTLFTGRIDYLYIWSRALIPAEVRWLNDDPWLFVRPKPYVAQMVTVPPQVVAPTSDISAGTWTPSTGATLYGVLDETVADDSDYMTSAGAPVADTAEVKFAPMVDPVASTGHILRYRFRMGN